jgi:hypothetical protein
LEEPRDRLDRALFAAGLAVPVVQKQYVQEKIGSPATCARGRDRPRWARTQGEAHAGCMGESEDADPPKEWRVIRACVVVESIF